MMQCKYVSISKKRGENILEGDEIHSEVIAHVAPILCLFPVKI